MSSQVRQALREATDAAHRRLHRHPVLAPLTAASLTRAQYACGLAALYGLHAAADCALAARWPRRMARAPVIARDLRTLGVEPESPAGDDLLPRYASPGAFLGGRWVVDGSAFGARAMLGNVRRVLGDEAGTAFLAGDSLETDTEWRSLLADLEELGDDCAGCEAACEAAVATFDAVERWLDRNAGPGEAQS